MTDQEWQLVADEITGLWGSGNQQLMERRVAVLRKRFKPERLQHMQAAVKQLEMHAAHWPPVKDFHAALDAIKARYNLGRTRAASEDQVGPLGPRQCIEIAQELVAAANDRISSGRGHEGDGWHRYLLGLAEHYEHGAAELRAGREFPWPPPGIPPTAALRRVYSDTRREDARDAQRRHAHLGEAGEWEQP